MYPSHLNTIAYLLENYNGSIPLSHYLKQYFARNKKHGSKDRKIISNACYCYFRAAKMLQHLPLSERITTAISICDGGLNKNLFDTSLIFPIADELSEGMDEGVFALSHLTQPDLFIRIRPGRESIVIRILDENNIAYKKHNDCLRLSNNTAIDKLLQIDKDIVIQDLSSQSIANIMYDVKDRIQPNFSSISLWDCCAASGGKSILAYDIFDKMHISVSDIRKSILHNLQQRFERAGINNYDSFAADLSHDVQSSASYNIILCDAPCSGSGTWGRTPEQLYFFDKSQIAQFAQLQKRIAINASKHLSRSGYFIYITCSVFKKENEEVVQHILKNTQLQLIKQELITGYDKKADSMFVAYFSNE